MGITYETEDYASLQVLSVSPRGPSFGCSLTFPCLMRSRPNNKFRSALSLQLFFFFLLLLRHLIPTADA